MMKSDGIKISYNVLKALFKNVFFINGTAYAGKSTMIKMLSEKYGGICLGENYTEKYFGLIDPVNQPNLCYFQTMSGWQEFVNRSADKYEAWIDGCSAEGAELEILELIRCTAEDKPIFVDTNIPLNILREISDYNHIAIMLSEPVVSVNRFFERPDAEKQFLYRKIMESESPETTMANFRDCLQRINSEERYQMYENSGFFVLKRDDARTPEETLDILERHFGLR